MSPHEINTPLKTIKLRVEGMDNAERAQQLIDALQSQPGVSRLDVNQEKRLIRVVSSPALELSELQSLVAPYGFRLAATLQTPPAASPLERGTMNLAIDGMHCQSCEITIERKFKKIAGVEKVEVDAARGSARIVYQGEKPEISALTEAIHRDGYTAREFQKHERPHQSKNFLPEKRPTLWQLIGLFALVLILGKMMSQFGLLKPAVTLGDSIGFGAVFLLGLVAASSSCLAVAGGLMLSSAAKFHERYGNATHFARMRPVLMFVIGRIVGYGFLGGLIGLLGNALSPSPLVTGLITILAALYMLIMGLDMLHLAPVWMKRLMPRMPKSLSHRVLDAEGKEHPLTPALLGAATFFLPCGFTQALQLYALTTGSMVTSAFLLFAFALGTAPALLALGWASGSLKGKLGQFFFRFSGALVVVLGLWNIQNGFTITGYPLSLAWLTSSEPALASSNGRTNVNDPNVIFDGREQTVNMKIGGSGYEPNDFTIRAGVPTKWVIDAKDGGGCLSVIQAPKLGIRKLLERGLNTIEFAASEPGTVPFSCSMGMFRGTMRVVPNS